MASLSETAAWESNIYRIQVYDPILGGEDGVVNTQPLQIANRTGWLLGLLNAEHLLGSEHQITDDMVADDAAIDSSKVVLDVSFTELRASLSELDDMLSELDELVTELAGSDGVKVLTLSDMLKILWKFTTWAFAFERFNDLAYMRLLTEDYDLVNVVGTVAADDTVILSSTAALTVGDHVLVTSEDKTDTELVTVGTILNATRFLATESLTSTRTSGYVTSCTWDLTQSPVVAQSGGWYLSDTVSVLTGASSGFVVIRRDTSDYILSVYVAKEAESLEWVELSLYQSEDVDDDTRDDYYTIPGAYAGYTIVILVKNETEESVAVTQIAVSPKPVNMNDIIIPAPTVMDPYDTVWQEAVPLLCSGYRNVYRDPYDHTEFKLVSVDDGTEYSYSITTRYPTLTFEDMSDADPGEYTVYARHVSDMGDVSLWSNPVTVTLQETGEYTGFLGANNGDRLLDGTDDDDSVSDWRSLDYAVIRFGFEGTEHTAGFDTVFFATEDQLS